MYIVNKTSKNTKYYFSIILAFRISNKKEADQMLKCIKHFNQQTFKDFELILIDDYSNNKFKKIWEPIIYELNNVTYLTNRFNYGVYISKNLGMYHSKGDVICYCDSDDNYAPSRLEYYSELFSNKDVYYTYEKYLDYNGLTKFTPISLVMRKECVYDIGYFNSCRFSCDSEYMNKIFNYYSNAGEYIQDEIIIKDITKNVYYKKANRNKFKFVDKDLYIVDHSNSGDRLSHNVPYTDFNRKIIYYNYVARIKSHLTNTNDTFYYKPDYIPRNVYIKDKVTIICPTNKANLVKFIATKFNNFLWKHKELIICLHDINVVGQPVTCFSNSNNIPTDATIKYIKFPKDSTIGNMMNYGINNSDGEYIFKMDDDDYYSPEYICNQVRLHKKYDNNRVIGKSSFYIYFKDTDEIKYYGWKLKEGVTDWIGGFSISFHRSLTDMTNFKYLSVGEDSNFIETSKTYGYNLSTSELNQDVIFIRYDKLNTLIDNSLYRNSHTIEDKTVETELRAKLANITYL